MSDEHLASASVRGSNAVPIGPGNPDRDPLTERWVQAATALTIATGGSYISIDELAVTLEWADLLGPLGVQPPTTRPDWYDGMLAKCRSKGFLLKNRSPIPLPFDYNLSQHINQVFQARRPLRECFQALMDSKEKVFLDLYDSALLKARKDDPREVLKAANECALTVESVLLDSLVGQSESVEALKRLAFQLELGRGTKAPPATALFLGPPGSGKSLAARGLSEGLKRHAVSKKRTGLALLEVEMTQHVQWSSGGDLFGDGTKPGSIPTFVAKNPRALIICNEFEKAHRKVLEAFLPVLDQGFVQIIGGKQVDFREAVFVFTTNLGSEFWSRQVSSEAGSLEVDLMDLLELAEKPDEKSEWFKTPVPKELLSRLGKGALVLFRRHQGHHMLEKIRQSCPMQKQDLL